MKGIRKLFLGLFLVALFGAGFKVETQAAVTKQLKGAPTVGDVNYEDTTAGAVVTGTFTYSYDNNAGSFPSANNTYVTYRIRLQTGTNDADGTAIGTPRFICFRTDDTGKHYIGQSTVDPAGALANATTEAETTGTDLTFSATAERADVKAKNTKTAPLSIKLYLTKVAGEGDAPVLTQEAGTATTATKIVTSKTDPVSIPGVEVTPANAYLLPGQEQQFTVSITSTNVGKKFDGWVISDTGKLTDKGATNTLPEIYQKVMLQYGVGATEPMSVTANYITGGVVFTWPAGSVSPGTSINPSFVFTGYTSDDIYNSEVYVDSVSASKKLSSYTLNNLSDGNRKGNLRFNAPVGNGGHKLLLKMKDGNVLETSEFTVADTTKLSWKSTSAISDGVAVTNGKEIFLYHFLSTGTLKEGEAKLSSPATDYSSITASGDRVIGSAKLVGSKAMTGDSGKKDKITLSPDDNSGTLEGKVTVYPQISIATNSSSSDDSLNSGSSSTTSKDTPIKITSPTYVYYGDTDYQVKKIQLRIAGPAGTEKKTLDAPSSDSTSNLTWSASVDSIKLSKILKEVCDSSSNTLTITAKPYNGDNVDDNLAKSVEIKAYKINLDGGGGAKYTVNGEDMGDYFYAVKGTRYTIKAQPKVSGDKFLNWDGSVFSSESGGDFTASESRTFRANYSSSSSSSNTNKNAINGESMSGDYDDVPKTGESKTDIWILWSVLFISILGAGFMIWKRFGLARAIAEADAEVAHAEYEEQVKAAEKEKKDKLDMLKDLRNL